MYRYRVQRFWKEFDLIKQKQANLTVPDLTSLDQYHYLGTSAVDHAAKILNISDCSQVLDIGSGIGGTSRYLAWKYGCQVTGVELQEQLHQVGMKANEITQMTEQVQLMQGDFTDISNLPISDHSFDSWVSMNVFLHICDRTTLFQNCARVLKPEGRFYIEDYYAAQDLPESDRQALAEIIACPYLPSREQYLEDLEKAGFQNIEFVDMSALWQPWLQERYEKFEAKREYYLALFDVDMVNSYSHFYQTVVNLFSSGNVSGARIYGTN
ncbi:MAG: hypothetical protein DCE90_18265 [Pseudanabaena sp.]|nr:MAG: hypothetical protein DCE90_18265 [Pseudanabaena sp.]